MRRPAATLVTAVRCGIARAERSLTLLLGRPAAIRVRRAALAPALALEGLAGPPEAEVVGIHAGFGGGLRGHGLLLLERDAEERLADALLGGRVGGSDLRRSALAELGNVVLGAVASGIADARGGEIRLTPPAVVRDMRGAILHTVLAAAAPVAPEWLVVQASIRVGGADARGTLVLLPDPAGLVSPGGGRGGRGGRGAPR